MLMRLLKPPYSFVIISHVNVPLCKNKSCITAMAFNFQKIESVNVQNVLGLSKAQFGTPFVSAGRAGPYTKSDTGF